MTGDPTDINSTRHIVGIMQNFVSGGDPLGFHHHNGVVTALPMLPGDTTAYAWAITESGVIAGSSGGSAVLWQNGTVAALKLPHGPFAGATDISDAGIVCGWMGEPGGGPARGFLWTARQAIDMGEVLPGAIRHIPTSVNDWSTVCGYSTFSDPTFVFIRRAFVWRDGVVQDLGMIAPWINAYANSININNIIVGHCTGEFAGGDAFVWKGGVMHNLEDLIVHELDLSLINATSINDAGQIAAFGYYPEPDGISNIYVAMRLNPIPPLTGDLNCDWQVNVPDLLAVINAWGPCPSQPPGEPFTKNCHADFNDDGVVNHHDILAVVLNWTS